MRPGRVHPNHIIDKSNINVIMNNMDNRDPKTIIIKLLAIFGFFVTVGLIVWVVVVGVRNAPAAFSSLASIAESIQGYQKVPELTLATEKSIMNSGESFTLSWTDIKKHGSYEFGYQCVEGISLEVRGASGELVTIPCGGSLSLPGEVHGLFVTISSERSRFIDVPLTLSFVNESGEVVTDTVTAVTIVNATIPLAMREEEIESVAITPEVTKPEMVKEEEVKPVVKPQEPVTPTAPAVPTTREVSVTYMPVSIPTGYTDLKVSFLGIGTMDGNTFVPSATYDPDKRSGLRFEVRNIGTKTSGNWSFTANLPEGVIYEAETQAPLKPNEAAVFTLGFGVDPDTKEDSVKLGVTATEKSDTNKVNNSFTWSVKIEN